MGRSPCCNKEGLKKGPWLPEEDQKLIDYINQHGPGNWRTLPKKAGLERCGKSCRLRWTNYLRPDIKRGRFSFEEEEAIIQLHSVLGNKWSAIAAKLPGRTDNEIKNYWNTHIRKRLLRMGVDPVTHTRRLDFLDLPSIFNSTSSAASLLQNSSTDQQHHQQLNLLKLLGLQSLVNPDLLNNLASLLSTNQHQNQNHLLQNLQPNDQMMMQNQLLINSDNNNNNNNPGFQNTTSMIPTSSTMVAPENATVFHENQMMKPSNYFEQFQQYPAYNIPNPDFENFGSHQNSFLQNDDQLWQNNMHSTEAVAGRIPDCDTNYQAVMDSLLETLGLDSTTVETNHENDLKMPSMLSTPCNSQQTTPPLSNSNSAYQPNSSSTTTTTTTSSEDHEIDSYCQNLMNFDVPFDLFVNNV